MIVLRRLRASTLGVTHVAAPLQVAPDQPWFAVLTSLVPATPEGGSYVAEIDGERTVIWAALDGPPSDAQFTEIVESIIDRRRNALGAVSMSDDGGIVVSLDEDAIQ